MEPEIDGPEHSEEYTAEFEKLAAGEEPSSSKAEKPKDDTAPPAAPKETPLAPADDQTPSGDGEPKTGEPAQDAPAAPKGDAGITKALKDTKAWATKLAMEKAELEKQLETLKAGSADTQKVEEAVSETRKVLDEKIKKASEDYPELKEVFDLLAKTSDEALSKARNFDTITAMQSKQLKARQHFEAEVEPLVLEEHPDFRKVAFSKEYMTWVEKQSPATQYAAMNSLDPQDISDTLTKYKKSLAGGDVDKAKAEEASRLKGIKENLSNMRGGGSVSKNSQITKLEDIDPDDRDGAFDFLAAQDGRKR